MRTAGKVLLPLLILVAAVAFAGYLRATRPPVGRAPMEERVWVVSAAPVRITDEKPEFKFFGEIVAGREVELRPLVGGRVIEVGRRFVDGAQVRKGDLLIAIDPFDYRIAVEEAEARVAEAEAKLAEYEAQVAAERRLLTHDRELVALRAREAERRRKLLARGTGSRKALDDALMALSEQRQGLIVREQTIARLEAQRRQQRAVLERLRVALRRARHDLERTRLVAPFDGFLVDTRSAVGKMVGTGDTVARLIDASRLEARFHMSDRQFALFVDDGGLRGRQATVVWRAGARAFRFRATVDRVSSEINAASGGIDVFARIEGTDLDTVLRPGAFVEIRVPGPLYRQVVRLPEDALHGGNTVYAVVDGRLQPRRVELVGRAGDDVLVRGELGRRDRVVTTAFAEIGPGVRVVVR